MIDLYFRINRILHKIFIDMTVPTNGMFNSIIHNLGPFKVYKSPFIDNTYYKFYSSYDNYFDDYSNFQELFDSSNIIPILIISYPEIYKTGNILFRNKSVSIREVLSGEANEIPNINMFVFLDIEYLRGQFFGYGEFNINVDTNVDWDIYGLYSKDVLSLVSTIFSANRPFNQSNFQIIDSNKNIIYKLFILFNQYKRVSSPDAILFRDKNSFIIRQCNIFSLLQDLMESGYSGYEVNIQKLDSIIEINNGKEIILLNI